MTFKKYSEFVAQKSKTNKFVVSTNIYKDFILAELSSLVLKDSKLFDEAKNYLINHEKINNLVEGYPQASNIKIAMKSNNIQSMKKCLNDHSRNLNSEISALLETSIFNYESKIMGKRFNSSDVDTAIETLLDDCQQKIEKVKSKIYEGMKKFEIDFPVYIEVLIPTSCLMAEAVCVKMDSIEPFFFHFPFDGTSVKSLTKELNLKYQKIHDNLLEFFNNKKVTNSIITAYIADNDKNFYEQKRIDLALGMKTFISKDTKIYKNLPEGNLNVWKIKLANPNAYELDESYTLTNDTQIRWIEPIRKKRDEE